MFGLRGFECTRLRKIMNIKKKLFGLQHVHGYTRFLAVPERKFLDLQHVIELHTIFGCSRAKLSFYAIHGLHGAFRSVTPRITENPLYSFYFVTYFPCLLTAH